MSDPADTEPEEVEIDREGLAPVIPPTFEEWIDRLEKLFQMNGRPIPDPMPLDDLREPFDLGLTPTEAFDDWVAKTN